MSTDPFDELLELENDFYKEGYEAGVADSTHAGLIEGKLFGIEKGYEKALEIGKAQGRGLVWQQRLESDSTSSRVNVSLGKEQNGAPALHPESGLSSIMTTLSPLPNNGRLKKHVDLLMSLTDPATIPIDNSDEAVSEVDERITKIRARLKMISNMVGEALSPATTSAGNIEDSNGLSARH